MIARDVQLLPKAHLHLHLTGGMRLATLAELAALHGLRLPGALLSGTASLTDTNARGWWRFQRLYDLARQVIRTPGDVHRVIGELAEDDAADGSGWLELQVDPTGYAARLGGLIGVVEVVLAASRRASEASGVGIGVVIAANRTRHPLDAATLARLAARYSGDGVIGFGLSNDERRGPPELFGKAFRIADRAGLPALPHAGELAGPESVRAAVEQLGARRVGHGVRAVEDPAVLDLLATRGVTCEVCPSSNVALGVAASPAAVPLRALVAAGVPVALGADDPLLFGSRLTAQYRVARHVHGFSDEELAGLARDSIRASFCPEPRRGQLLAGVDAWLRG